MKQLVSLRERLKTSYSDGSFQKIRENDGFYLDKTKHIYDCLGRGTYFFFSRPRRFGKSLLCSTLEALFSAKRELFEGLWIDQSDWLWATYPIIKLDMSRVVDDKTTLDKVIKNLIKELKNIAQVHAISLPEDLGASTMMGVLVEELSKKYSKNVVVIIDEYDKPLLDVVDNSLEFNAMLEMFKAFYTQLKARSEHLRFVFATGVFKFSKVGMFSGANNFTDLTFDMTASTLIGYTQEELEENFSEGIDVLAKDLGVDRSEMLVILREKYNGYRFGYRPGFPQISQGVYNSFGINHVFANLSLIDQWFESGSPSILLKKLHAESCKTLLNQSLTTNPESLSSSFAPEKLAPLPLLYFAGYLTIKAYDPRRGKLTFGFPNGEVSQAFSRQLINELQPEESNAISDIACDIAYELANQSFDNLSSLFNQALANIGYKLLLTQEKQYQLAFFMLLNAGGLRAHVEEVTQDGRIDIIVEMRHCIYIMELKINESAADAIKQIKSKDYGRKYSYAKLPMWAIGMKLAGKSSKQRNAVLELVAEKL